MSVEFENNITFVRHPLAEEKTSTLRKGIDGRGKLVVVKEFKINSFPEQERRYRRHRAFTEGIIHEKASEVSDGVIPLYGRNRTAEGEKLSLIMKYANGGTADDIEEFSIKDRLDVLASLASTLRVLHAHGIVHRDIKPDNIFFHYDQEKDKRITYLGDFGTALWGYDAISPRGTVLGTADYLPPERLIDDGATRDLPSGDIWGWGVTAFMLLSGEKPFSAGSFSDPSDKNNVTESTLVSLLRAERTEIPLLPEVVTDLPQKTSPLAKTRINGAIREVIADALDPDPEQRTTAQELAAQTLTILADIAEAKAGKETIPYARNALVIESTAETPVITEVFSTSH